MQFVDRGFEIVDFTQPSDVYVLNTCSVTERAERECRQIIRRALRQSPDAFIIVVGCYAQLRAGEIAAIEESTSSSAQKKNSIFSSMPGDSRNRLPRKYSSPASMKRSCSLRRSRPIPAEGRAPF